MHGDCTILLIKVSHLNVDLCVQKALKPLDKLLLDLYITCCSIFSSYGSDVYSTSFYVKNMLVLKIMIEIIQLAILMFFFLESKYIEFRHVVLWHI